MFTIRRRRQAHEPVIDERVAALLDAAAAPADPGPVAGETEALAVFRDAHQTARSRRSPMLSPSRLRTAAAAVLGTGVLLTGGVAAAQVGSLPAPAQDTARAVLAKVGITVPGADEHAQGHADPRGASTDAPRGSGGGSEADAPAEKPSAHASHGVEVSKLARTTDSEGADKGAEISGVASAGNHADAHGRPEAPGQPAGSSAAERHAQVTTPNTGGSDHPARPAAGGSSAARGSSAAAGRTHPPVSTPNSGGTATADTASGGPAMHGTGMAKTSSDGRSAAGSGNASDNPSTAHRPAIAPANPKGDRP